MIWKTKAGKTLPGAVARELIAHGPHGPAGDRLQGPLRTLVPRASSRSSRATTRARWRVEFDEPWAKEGAKPPETAEAAEPADETVAAGADEGAAAA